MTTWKYGSTQLENFGRVTLINDYLDIPNKRGENVTVPFRHGKIWTKKYYDERVLTMGLVVVGTSASDLEGDIDTLKKLLAIGTQQTLEMTREDASKRQAPAEVTRTMAVERVSPKIAKCIVEFTLARPFFRSDTDIADNTTVIDASPHAMEVVNPGTIEERDATIILTGPLQNTVITNTTNGCTLTYTGTIASPRVVTIQTATTGQYTATTDLSANVIGNVSHSGASALMVFEPGTNTLSITDATATTGSVKVVFKAPYL